MLSQMASMGGLMPGEGAGLTNLLNPLAAFMDPVGQSLGVSPWASLLGSMKFQKSGPGGSFYAGGGPMLQNAILAKILPMMGGLGLGAGGGMGASASPTPTITTAPNRGGSTNLESANPFTADSISRMLGMMSMRGF